MMKKTVILCLVLSLFVSSVYGNHFKHYFERQHRAFNYGSFAVTCPSLSSTTTSLGGSNSASVIPPDTTTGYACTLVCDVNGATWDGKSTFALTSGTAYTVKCTGNCKNTAGYSVTGTCTKQSTPSQTYSGPYAVCPQFDGKVTELDVNGGADAAPKMTNQIAGATCTLACTVNGNVWDMVASSTYPLTQGQSSTLQCTAACATNYGTYKSTCTYSGYPKSTSTGGGTGYSGPYPVCPQFNGKVTQLDINGGADAAPKMTNEIPGTTCSLSCTVNGNAWDFKVQPTYPLIGGQQNTLVCEAKCVYSWGGVARATCTYSGYPAVSTGTGTGGAGQGTTGGGKALLDALSLQCPKSGILYLDQYGGKPKIGLTADTQASLDNKYPQDVTCDAVSCTLTNNPRPTWNGITKKALELGTTDIKCSVKCLANDGYSKQWYCSSQYKVYKP
jgi:hypothetical protein